MEAPPPPTSKAEAEASEDLYHRWLEWVSINLGHDSDLASAAARAASQAALQGAGFTAAVEAARNAWFGGRPSHGRRSIDWLRAIGHVLIIGSYLMPAALVAVMGIGFLASRNYSGPIVVCPDMCGVVPQGPTPALSADVIRWTPGGDELAGTITSLAGPPCMLPTVQVEFFDSNGAAIGSVDIVLVTAVASGQTLNWDVKFWPPPGLDETLDYRLEDGTRIIESGAMTGPIPPAAMGARVTTDCLKY